MYIWLTSNLELLHIAVVKGIRSKQRVIREREIAKSVNPLRSSICDVNSELAEQKACDQRYHRAVGDHVHADHKGCCRQQQ